VESCWAVEIPAGVKYGKDARNCAFIIADATSSGYVMRLFAFPTSRILQVLPLRAASRVDDHVRRFLAGIKIQSNALLGERDEQTYLYFCYPARGVIGGRWRALANVTFRRRIALAFHRYRQLVAEQQQWLIRANGIFIVSRLRGTVLDG